jgi:hypothetical protein
MTVLALHWVGSGGLAKSADISSNRRPAISNAPLQGIIPVKEHHTFNPAPAVN